jgi:hypothetical protein
MFLEFPVTVPQGSHVYTRLIQRSRGNNIAPLLRNTHSPAQILWLPGASQGDNVNERICLHHAWTHFR